MSSSASSSSSCWATWLQCTKSVHDRYLNDPNFEADKQLFESQPSVMLSHSSKACEAGSLLKVYLKNKVTRGEMTAVLERVEAEEQEKKKMVAMENGVGQMVEAKEEEKKIEWKGAGAGEQIGNGQVYGTAVMKEELYPVPGAGAYVAPENRPANAYYHPNGFPANIYARPNGPVHYTPLPGRSGQFPKAAYAAGPPGDPRIPVMPSAGPGGFASMSVEERNNFAMMGRFWR